MPFSAIEGLASERAAEEERRRRMELAALAQDEQRLGQDALDQKRRFGPPVDEEDRFLDEQKLRRFEHRASGLNDRKAELSVPGETAGERYDAMTAPLGRFAHEEATRDDLPELQRLRQGLREDVPRETPPIYTDAPRRGGATRGMPYEGALEGLRGAEVPRSAIRREFGGTAPDTVLSFSDRPERGMRRYDPDRGDDVGAPGGGLVSASGGGEREGSVRAAQSQDLDALIRSVERQPLGVEEAAQDLVTQMPGWDKVALESGGPAEVQQLVLEALAAKRLRPETAEQLQSRYANFGKAAFDKYDKTIDPNVWRDLLGAGRAPAPGEAEARAKTGGQGPVQAAEAERTAVQDALQAPENGPGATRSPSLMAEAADPRDALLAGLRPQRQVQQIGGQDLGYEIGGNFIPETGREAVPPWLADLPEDIRLLFQGLSQAAGGHEHSAERQRRLRREAGRRE